MCLMSDPKSRVKALSLAQLIEGVRQTLAEEESDEPFQLEPVGAPIASRAPVMPPGYTVKDLMREDRVGDLSREMLRIWLDEKLPNIVACQVRVAVAEEVYRQINAPTMSFARMVVSLIRRNTV